MEQLSNYNAFRSVMATTEGRQWVWWLLDRCGVFHTSFSADIPTSFYKEGSRSVGLMVIADINALCPEQFSTMIIEANKLENCAAG